MSHLTIATQLSEVGLGVRFHQHGGLDEVEETWTLERNQWGLMVSAEAADCLATITRRVASQCIYPYAMRERLQESIYGGKAVEIQIDTDAAPVARVHINGREVR